MNWSVKTAGKYYSTYFIRTTNQIPTLLWAWVILFVLRLARIARHFNHQSHACGVFWDAVNQHYQLKNALWIDLVTNYMVYVRSNTKWIMACERNIFVVVAATKEGNIFRWNWGIVQICKILVELNLCDLLFSQFMAWRTSRNTCHMNTALQ